MYGDRCSGLVKRYIITFKLPTEYKGSLKNVEKRRDRDEIIETRVLRKANQYRSLRKLFYARLHRVAWPSPLGWVRHTRASEDELRSLSEVVEKLEELSGEKRLVEVYEVYLPARTLKTLIERRIAVIEDEIEAKKRRLREEELKARQRLRLASALRELERELRRLEEELAEL